MTERVDNMDDIAKCNFCGTTLPVSELYVLKRPPTSKTKLKEIFWCNKCYSEYLLKGGSEKNILPPTKA